VSLLFFGWIIRNCTFYGVLGVTQHKITGGEKSVVNMKKLQKSWGVRKWENKYKLILLRMGDTFGEWGEF
jgi:hypothetical protein